MSLVLSAVYTNYSSVKQTRPRALQFLLPVYGLTCGLSWDGNEAVDQKGLDSEFQYHEYGLV